MFICWKRPDWLDPDKPLVVKYSGLAEGKGVFLTNNRKEFIEALEEIDRRYYGGRYLKEKGQKAQEA